MKHDLVVIGGGIIGASIAWGAAREGASVVVIDGEDRDFRASVGNFGLIWIQGKGLGHHDYALLNQRVAGLWPDFAVRLAAASGIDFGYQQRGGFQFLLTSKEADNRAAQIERLQRQSGDIGISLLDNAALKVQIADIGAGVVAASYCALDGAVNSLLMLRALQISFERAGGEIVRGARVNSITPSRGQFSVKAGERHIVGEHLVIAAGLGSRDLAREVGIDLPIFPQRGQIMVTERVRRFLTRPNSSIRQMEEGTVLLGSTQEDVGFDNGVETGGLARIAYRAAVAFPLLEHVRIARSWGCLRVMTPDGSPIYETSGSHPGAFAVAAHSGITLAPLHVEMLGRDVLNGSYSAAARAFSAARFANRRGFAAVSEH